MNRPIKYRVWDKNNNRMLYPTDYEYIQFRDGWLIRVKTYNFEEDLWQDTAEFLQFTWLTDKNWKEIYEWDKVVWNFTYAEICLVIWDEKRCWFYLKPIEWFSASDKYFKMNSCKPEIIWNIYENPELLTK